MSNYLPLEWTVNVQDKWIEKYKMNTLSKESPHINKLLPSFSTNTIHFTLSKLVICRTGIARFHSSAHSTLISWPFEAPYGFWLIVASYSGVLASSGLLIVTPGGPRKKDLVDDRYSTKVGRHNRLLKKAIACSACFCECRTRIRARRRRSE